MKVIYYSYWGVYAAYLTAALHVGNIHEGSIDRKDFLDGYWRFCRSVESQYGNLIFVGVDSHLREVYCMGCKSFSRSVIKAQTHMKDIFGIDEALEYVNVREEEGLIPRVLSWLLRYSILRQGCYRLFCLWVKTAYPRCAQKLNTCYSIDRKVHEP